MKRTRTPEFLKDHHHLVSTQLDSIEWVIIGHLTFPTAIAHTHYLPDRDKGKVISQEDISEMPKPEMQRKKKFAALMNAMAMFAELKTKKLVYFQNNEVEPEKDFHHIHFLIGRSNMEHVNIQLACDFLLGKAKELGFESAQIEAFDPSKDGVGYVTKKVFKRSRGGKFECMDFNYHLSKALVKLLTESTKL